MHIIKLIILLALLLPHAHAQQESDWNFLVVKSNNTVAIRGVRKLEGSFVSFSLLNGYLPEGRQLGTGLGLVGLTMYNVIHKCGTASATLIWGSARDIQGQLIFEKTFEPPTEVSVSGSPGLGMAVTAACRTDNGLGMFLTNPEGATDEVTLVCKFTGHENELVVTFSESQRKANGGIAMITQNSIQFSRETDGKVSSISINRLTGQLSLQITGQSQPFFGACSKAEAKKF
jgi:hypothetical protein